MTTFGSLKCLSLNARGLRDNVKRKAVFLFCRRKNFDIFLQETHSIEDDTKFWRNQWGDLCYFSHGTNQSAGVAILLIKPKGDILDTVISEDGRRVIIVEKLNDAFFIICNVYGYNVNSLSKQMFTTICSKIQSLRVKYHSAFVIMGGDFNDAPNDQIDRVPAKAVTGARFKCTN